MNFLGFLYSVVGWQAPSRVVSVTSDLLVTPRAPLGAPRCTALDNALSDSESRGTIAPTIQLLSRTDSRAMVYMDTMQFQIFSFFTTNFEQIYKHVLGVVHDE